MINNTLILVVLHLYYLLLSVNLGMKSNQSKMFAQVAKVQLSVTFSPLTVTGRNMMHPNFTSSDNHVNIYRSFQNWSTWNQNFVVFPVKKKTYGCWNCRYVNYLVLEFFLGFCWRTQLSITSRNDSCGHKPSQCAVTVCLLWLLLRTDRSSYLTLWRNSLTATRSIKKPSVVDVYRRGLCGFISHVNIFPSEFTECLVMFSSSQRDEVNVCFGFHHIRLLSEWDVQLWHRFGYLPNYTPQ